MNCVKCSTELPSGKLFCPSCGTMNKERAREVVVEVKNEEVGSTASSENYYKSKKIDFSVFKEFFLKSRKGNLVFVILILLCIFLSPLGKHGYYKYQDYLIEKEIAEKEEKEIAEIQEKNEKEIAEIQEKNKEEINLWSEHLGSMNWTDANDKCESIGMRIPTIGELKEAYASGITKLWQKNVYWSSTPYDAEYYYNFLVDYGITDRGLRDTNYGVRCRR